MFGIPFIGGGGNPLLFGLAFGVFFVVNLVLQFFTGGLEEIFPTTEMMEMMTEG